MDNQVFDILNELATKGKLRYVTLSGYVVREIPKPKIFSSEVLEEGKFVDFKVQIIKFNSKNAMLTTGNVVCFIPKEVASLDFYDITGTLSFGGHEHTRLVTLMKFAKSGSVDSNGKNIWTVSPCVVADLEVSTLNTKLYNEVMSFADSPLVYESEEVEFLVKPKSVEEDRQKVKYYFKGERPTEDRILSTKKTIDFENEKGYLIDKEYEILREALRYRVLNVVMTDFGSDKMLLEYMQWLTDYKARVVDKVEDLNEEERFILVTDQELDDFPTVVLTRGDVFDGSY